MRHVNMLFVALAFLIAASVAQEKTPEAAKAPVGQATITLKGYVVDQMCAKGIAKKANPMIKASSHTKECCLEDNCADSGFGIFSEGKWYKFDPDGSKTAKGLVEKDKRDKGLAYEVSGSVDGSTLKVVSMKATTLEAEKK